MSEAQETQPTLRPLFDRVLIRRTVRETQTAGGILLPDHVENDGVQRGEVVATGSGLVTRTGVVVPLEVKPGDTVLFPPRLGAFIKLDGESYVMLSEGDIMGTENK